MHVFIFPWVSQVSDRYHADGGLTIVARDRARVQELCDDHPAIILEPADWEGVVSYPIDAPEDAEHVFVFPDAGCC